MEILRTRPVRIDVEEPARTPVQDIVLAYLAVVLPLVGASGSFLLPEAIRPMAIDLTLLWAAAIVLFLSGVRRGLSFRTPGGPTFAQLAMMTWLYLAGFGSLIAVVCGYPLAANLLTLVAYASLGVLDPIAAKRKEAPIYFARLRPFQMSVAVLALLILLVQTGGFRV